MTPDPVVVCVAPNGARRGKDAHRELPLTADETARVAAACADAGATVLHLHVRDAEGRHSLAAELYRASLAAIEREACGRLVVQVTTESAGRYTPAAQMALVRALEPAAVSIAMRELVGADTADGEAARFYAWAAEARIGVQHIVYTAAEVERLVTLARQGVLAEDRPHALFVLGAYGVPQRPSDPRALVAMLAGWPPDWPWTTCAFGRTEARCAVATIGLGGHVRVGMENNLERADGSALASNAESVAAVRAILEATDRRLGTIEDARRLYAPRRGT